MQRPDTELVRNVERFIREHRLLEPRDSIVAAVSGGPDSTALLHILHRLSEAWGWTLTAAHLDHGFRGPESVAEAEGVAAFAHKLGIRCELGAVDMPAIVRASGDNPQTAAREERYAFLAGVAARVGAVRLATAHHANDQAETVLMRLLRGTGPSGLTGIPMRRRMNELELVRPLLRIYKEELVRYCEMLELPYAEDSSNRSRKYTRNRIRLDVWPALLPFNPQLPESINRLADLMQEEDDFIRQEALRIWPTLVTEFAHGIAFSRTAFLTLHIALQRRIIHLILNYVCEEADASDYNRVERIRHAIGQEEPPSVTIQLQGTAALVREYDRVSVLRQAEFAGKERGVQASDEEGMTRTQAEEGAVRWGGALYGTIRTLADWKDRARETQPMRPSDGAASWIRSSPQEAFFDFDQVEFPLKVRLRREGDRMEPLGLKGSKKVKDMFIDHKVPPSLRDRLPLIEDGAGRLLWIPGLRRSRHALIGPGTERVLALRLDLSAIPPLGGTPE
ncbi:tRNA lysidine(34) synthetase TilS [Paenibacillus sp. HJGM_3]|uniref:tRNA lysidine(34) synthetase TilS n=1 Tax=Paenibacillus sp. HJGM_3 TaxID=3379816 RepID=UPI00385871FE